MYTRVKICGIKNQADLQTALQAGSDAIGFLVGQTHPSNDFITPKQASTLQKQIPPFSQSILVTHLNNPQQIANIAQTIGTNNIQLHGTITIKQIQHLKQLIPNSKLILAVHIQKQQLIHTTIQQLQQTQPLIHAFLFDTYCPTNNKIGGTGKTHNWDYTATIAKQLNKPTIIAGGITPQNAQLAIDTLKPYAIDINTGVENQQKQKCPQKCKTIIQIAHNHRTP